MLADIEKKMTAILGDGLVTRAHVQVVEGATADPPTAGKELITVSLADVSPDHFFDREQLSIGPAGPSSAPVRRILPLHFTVQIGFSIRPQNGDAAANTAARALLLDDISLAAHLLADIAVREGTAFRTAAPDPGFEVQSMDLDQGTVASQLAGGIFSAQLAYKGKATVWPVDVVTDQGAILAAEPVLVALPLEVKVDSPSVRAGTGTRLRIRSVRGQRLVNPATQQRSPLQLAVSVVSDLPMGQRGAITSGNPGVETGFRIITATDPETLVDYQAPAGNLGNTRLEFVAIHLATPDGHRGTFLASVPVALGPGGNP